MQHVKVNLTVCMLLFFNLKIFEIMALKYNPLLKLNLQEETDAAEIIGDGYNEKLLTWDDFLNDCQTITYDTGEIRKYSLNDNSRNTTGKNLICNFSFEIFCNNYGIFNNGYSMLLNSNVAIFHNNVFFGAGGGDAPFIYNCQIVKFINARALSINKWLVINNNAKSCIFLLLNCGIWNAGNKNFNPNNLQTIIYLNCKWTNNIPANCTFQHAEKFAIICNNSLSNYFNNKSSFYSFVGIDTALDINSPGLLPNSVITAALNNLQPDSTLDGNSTNAIQNQAVTAAINTINQSIGSITNKVSKFHSASDSLVENEIAQYQGEDDSDNGLTRGYFYEQGQGWQKVPTGTTQTVTVNQYWRITDVNDNIRDYYDLGYNYLNNLYKILHTTDNTTYIYIFTGLLNNDLNTYQADGYTYFVYPFAKINNVFDFDNALEVIENKFYLNGNLLSISGSAEGGFVLGEKLLNLAKDTLYLSAYQSNAPFMFEFDSSENVLLTSPLKNAYIKSETTVSITAETVTYTEYTIQAGAAGFVPVPVQDLTPINNFVKTTVTNTDTFSDSSGSFSATATIYKNSFMCFVKLELTTTTNSTQPINDTILNIGFNVLESAFISCINPSNNNTFALTLSQNGNISFKYGSPSIPTATQLTFTALLA